MHFLPVPHNQERSRFTAQLQLKTTGQTERGTGASLLGLAASAVLITTAGCATDPAAESDAPVELVQETAHVLEEVAPGVYFANSAGTGEVLLMSNAMVIVNEDDVVVVDSHVSADSGRSLEAAVRTVSDLPIHYLINTHYHFDHAHGNQVFAHNHTEIIGHEYTRERLLGPVLTEPTYQTIGSPEATRGQLAGLESAIAAAPEDQKAALEAQAAMVRRHIGALDEVTPTPPNVTLTDKMSLFRGDREIQVLHLGRGHTGGDVVIYLPKERLVFTGDLFYAGAPYLGDAFVDEFPATLEKLKSLDVDLIVPGHGPLVRDKAQIDVTQNYLRSYWDQVKRSHAAGLSVEEAVAALDMTGYEEYAAFNINTPGVLALEVTRMYQRMDSK